MYVVIEYGGGWDNPDIESIFTTDSKAIAEDAEKKLHRPIGNEWWASVITHEAPHITNWDELNKFLEERLGSK